MRRLVDGYRRFHSFVFPQKRTLYASLAERQKPRYMFLTCADSRVDPLDFTGTNAGDMFMERSLGNIVSEPGSQGTESTSSIEYAVVALGVEHVIVCGHSQCGAMKALLNPESLVGLPTVDAWLAGAARTREIVARKYPHLSGDELLSMAVRENVLVQLDHVRRQPSVAPRVLDGRLQIHGWVFEIEHGRVIAYDPKADAFVPLTQAYPGGRTWR
jgi:carbonic anhydrase